MRAQPFLTHTQPLTHSTSNKNCFQWLKCVDYNLSQDQLNSFYSLKDEANILFEGENQRWDLIKSMYRQYFKSEPKTSGKQFIRLGFQGEHPETDFRGGGIISLQLICRFINRYRDTVLMMQNDKGNFFFAITAINIAFFMKKYFHLADFLVAIKDSNVYCNRRALKSFCAILRNSSQAFFNMHEQFLQHFYKKIWLQAAQIYPETLLQYNSLFSLLEKLIRNLFENYDMRTWPQFSIKWNKNIESYKKKVE